MRLQILLAIAAILCAAFGAHEYLEYERRNMRTILLWDGTVVFCTPQEFKTDCLKAHNLDRRYYSRQH